MHARAAWAWRRVLGHGAPIASAGRPGLRTRGLTASFSRCGCPPSVTHSAVHHGFECPVCYLFCVCFCFCPPPSHSSPTPCAPCHPRAVSSPTFLRYHAISYAAYCFSSQCSHSRPRAFLAALRSSFHRRVAPPLSPRHTRPSFEQLLRPGAFYPTPHVCPAHVQSSPVTLPL